MAAKLEPEFLSVRSLIARELQQVALEHGRTLGPLTEEMKLLESGLDSLGLAVVVIRLAEALGIDPFDSGKSAASPATFGELVRMYESLQEKALAD
jgi:acyl carrier protein